MKSSADQEKQNAANAAFEHLEGLLADNGEKRVTLGIGTGSTVQHFINKLPSLMTKINHLVSSSKQSTDAMKALELPVTDLNQVSLIDYYVDGADECDPHLNLIKGGGGALTQEKILASNSNVFIGIADHTKLVQSLGKFPLPIEVIPMARSAVARKIATLGGNPVYRSNFITDNHNVILDVYGLNLSQPLALEHELKHIPGVVETGIFAHRRADHFFIAKKDSVDFLSA